MLVAGRCQGAIGEHDAINAASFLQLPQLGSQGLGSQDVQHGGQRAALCRT
jgi:hypothetical protein